MISLKRYLDRAEADSPAQPAEPQQLPSALAALSVAYRSALTEVRAGGIHICAAPGERLGKALAEVEQGLGDNPAAALAGQAESTVREALREWAESTTRHYQGKAQEAKDLLLTLARAAHSVGERDGLCAEQMSRVTERLNNIASLEDLTAMRASVQESALELKASIDRMTAAGHSAMDELRAEIADYRMRLEEAEYVASRDMLTGLGNRPWAEAQIEERMLARRPFCAVLIDIDDFKQVNDEHGHIVGDELLKQFASELRAVCRSTDIVCRWGGDEFVMLMDGGLEDAAVQTGRLREWVCGNYTLKSRPAPLKLHITASIGVAEYVSGESPKQLFDRADSAMYRNKAQARRPLQSPEQRP